MTVQVDKTEKQVEIIINFLNAVESAAFDARRQLADLYKQPEAQRQPTPEAARSTTPSVNLTGLEKLPWKRFDKTPAGPRDAGWIFANTQGAEQLTEQVRQHGKVTVSSMEYTLSKPDQRFLNRKPIK